MCEKIFSKRANFFCSRAAFESSFLQLSMVMRFDYDIVLPAACLNRKQSNKFEFRYPIYSNKFGICLPNFDLDLNFRRTNLNIRNADVQIYLDYMYQ